MSRQRCVIEYSGVVPGGTLMGILTTLGSLFLILVVLVEGFETMVLPRRVTRIRLTRLFYRSSWTLWRALGLHLAPGKRREYLLSVFGPLSLLGLFATWVLSLILGFALLHWSFGTAPRAPEEAAGPGMYLYLSGVTFFTLGYSDITPVTAAGRVLSVAEAGLGFGFMAVLIGYL